MVYITSDGTILREAPPTTTRASRMMVVGLALLIGSLLVAHDHFSPEASNPLANDRVPAANARPDEHWSKLKSNTFLVRDMMDGLASIQKNADVVHHSAAENVDWTERTMLESIKVTRCATTQVAVTAYFCGAEVAGNQNSVGLSDNMAVGVDSLSFHLTCRHEQGKRDGNVHKRSVYRVDVVPANDELVFGHAFNIVAQPDGRFLWLQSFIGEYSLSKWLDKKDKRTESGLRGHLTLSEVLAKLDQINFLMEVESWDEEANSIYKDLFAADKSDAANDWDLSHRLFLFSWDEACEYPTTKESNGGSSADEGSNDVEEDECASEDAKAFSNLFLRVMRGDFDDIVTDTYEDDSMHDYDEEEEDYFYEDEDGYEKYHDDHHLYEEDDDYYVLKETEV